jgi:ADP-heptose:LPS heptosyltransferase/predicted SAM-dependent methyltransferase
MVWKSTEDWAGRETDKIWPFVVPYTRGRVLDVGSGAKRSFAHWITLDNGKMYGGKRVSDIDADGERDIPFADRSLDAIFSSHFLEHCAQWKGALGLWWSKVKVGGHIVLYVPHPDHYPKCGEPGANPDHKSDIYPKDVLDLFTANGGGWDCLEDEVRTEGSEYSWFMVFRKRGDDQQNYIPWRRKEKSVLIIRYGAFGDAILTAGCIPALKKQGWHVEYNAEENSAAVLMADPNIDRLFLNGKDQVPNENLGMYWSALSSRYDRMINFNESVENITLTLPGSSKDKWPLSLRNKHLDINYMEFTHDLAEVEYDFQQKFHATAQEIELANNQRKSACGDRPLIGWVLRGSSVHKVYPFVKALAARIIAKTDACIMLMGDKSCVEFENAILQTVGDICGKEAVKRIWVTCGDFPIRATMTFAAKVCDVMVGPETGVMNAAALEDNQKIIFLSHSSQENLTKHWKNHRVMEAFPACRPCHQLHYGWDRCTKDERTGAAVCQSMIDADDVEAAILAALAEVAHKNAKEHVEVPYDGDGDLHALAGIPAFVEGVKPEEDSGMEVVVEQGRQVGRKRKK